MVVVKSLVACRTPIILHPGDDGYDDWEMQEEPGDDGNAHPLSSDLHMQPLDIDADPPDDLREIGAYTYMQARKLCATRSWLWVVDDLFPTRSINIISSEPKAGKSTLVRSLLYGVTNGDRFLNRVCAQGPAVYYSLEDQMDLTVEMFSRNLSDKDTTHPLYIIESFKTCDDIITHMRMMNKAVKPLLFVIDTLQRGILLPDLNDYATVTVALDRFIEFVVNEAPQSCIVFIHHNHKTKDTEKGSTSANRIAGSVAIHGSVFTAMVMDVDDETGTRYVGTSQRRGDPLHRVPLSIDRNTLRIMLNGSDTPIVPRSPSPQTNRRHATTLAVLKEWFKETDAGMPLKELGSRLKKAPLVVTAAVNKLAEDGRVIKTGTGRFNDPVLVFLNPTWKDSST